MESILDMVTQHQLDDLNNRATNVVKTRRYLRAALQGQPVTSFKLKASSKDAVNLKLVVDAETLAQHRTKFGAKSQSLLRAFCANGYQQRLAELRFDFGWTGDLLEATDLQAIEAQATQTSRRFDAYLQQAAIDLGATVTETSNGWSVTHVMRKLASACRRRWIDNNCILTLPDCADDEASRLIRTRQAELLAKAEQLKGGQPDSVIAGLQAWTDAVLDGETSSPTKRKHASRTYVRNVRDAGIQARHRRQLLARYRGRCIIYDALGAYHAGANIPFCTLEAAHIVPWRYGDYGVTNGLLLHAVLHGAFDRFELDIDPDSGVVWLQSNSSIHVSLKEEHLLPLERGEVRVPLTDGQRENLRTRLAYRRFTREASVDAS